MHRKKQPTTISTVWILSLASLLCTTQALAGDVTGSLALPDSISYEKPLGSCKDRHCFWDERNGVVASQRLSRELSNEIAVVAIGRSSETTPNSFDLHLRGGGVEPSTLVAGVGSTLRVSNDDAFERKPLLGNSKELSGSAMAARTARTLKLLETGTQLVTDKTLPHAQGYIHVLSKLAAVASVSDSGAFRFTDLKSGSYTVQVYFQDQLIAKKNISVPARGTLKLDTLAVSKSGTKK
ncbi:MAG: hypothetical protein IPJ88_06910 [Myxococcales bacterium]|nr:MAG: hypothetical protein IPJ88_06910 [Myxococcales bacterium]